MRLLHTVRELNFGTTVPVALIALFTEVEREAMFVREADEAWRLDRIPDDRGGAHRDPAAVARSLAAARCDAAWVGWGVSASEQLAVAEICERLGIGFVGPDAEVLRRLSDATELAAIAETAGVLSLPPDALGTRTRHISVMIVADRHGTIWPLGAYERSCAHRGRTVIAELASSALSAGQEAEVLEAARQVASCARYVNAGAVEFAFIRRSDVSRSSASPRACRASTP